MWNRSPAIAEFHAGEHEPAARKNIMTVFAFHRQYLHVVGGYRYSGMMRGQKKTTKQNASSRS